jgi:hypothetical protein
MHRRRGPIREGNNGCGVIEIVGESAFSRGRLVQEQIKVRCFRSQRTTQARQRRGTTRIEHAQRASAPLRESLPRSALQRVFTIARHGCSEDRIDQRGAARGAIAEEHDPRRTL